MMQILPFVGARSPSRRLDVAMRTDKRICWWRSEADVDDSRLTTCTASLLVATILQLLKFDGKSPTGQRVDRARIEKQAGEYHWPTPMPLLDTETYDEKEMTCWRSVISPSSMQSSAAGVPPEVLTALAGIEQPGRLAEIVAAHGVAQARRGSRKVPEIRRQEASSTILIAIESEMDVPQTRKASAGASRRRWRRASGEYYLNEQMKAIQKELGDGREKNEIKELEQKIAKAGMPKEARTRPQGELNKLKMMSPMSAEATVVRNYIDWLVVVPWKAAPASCATSPGPRRCWTRTTMASRR